MLGSATLVAASSVHAQNTISEAEEAYLNVDFERTLELCDQALREGNHSPERVTRIYELMGVAHAANGDEDASREAYIKMLALDPESQVDTNLSPRLRSPFMEARGHWATRSERLTLDARLVRARASLRVIVTDPVSMATEVRVLTRVAGEMGEMNETRYPVEESRLVEVDGLPDADQIEYVVQLLDAHGNAIRQLGTEDEPRVVGRDPTTSGGVVGGGNDGGGIPVWVWGVVGGVAAAAGLGLGLYFGLRTEPITLRSGVSFQ